MIHLSVDEIIEFVSFNELSDETLAMAGRVNEHISKCADCLKKVKAFQTVYDELCKLNNANNSKQYLYKIVSDEELNALEKETITHAIQQAGGENNISMNNIN